MNILNKLTIRQLKMNKQRTIVTIIGVLLSCALMVGIGLLFSSVQRNMVDSIVKYNGDYHTSFNDIQSKDISLIENNIKVEKTARRTLETDAIRYGKTHDENDYFRIYTMNQEYQNSFRELKGRFPKNENEILMLERVMKTKTPRLKIGDTITLKLGELKSDEDSGSIEFEEGSSAPLFTETGEKTYKIVGTYVGDAYAGYFQSDINSLYIGGKSNPSKLSHVYITFKNLRDTYPESEHLAEELGKAKTSDSGMYSGLSYNQEYLSLNGNSRYNNYNFTLIAVVAFILTIISIACIVVIYNSFNISVMERKKQFGIFSSVGATKKQLRKTVFFEAIFVAVLGIPLGVLSGLLGIKVTMDIINHLLPNMFDVPFQFYVYPIFIIVPVIFMLIVIFVSAYLPAKRASKVQPIEAIRQNDDIKLEKRKLRTPKWITNLFGVEGTIALKNMKRNKKKYRVTVVSLFISMVLFITFSALLKYGLYGTNSAIDQIDYDASISITASSYEEMKPAFQRLKKVEGPTKYSEIHSLYTRTSIDSLDMLDNGYKKALKDYMNDSADEFVLSMMITTIENSDYQKLLKQTGANKDSAIVINHYGMTTTDGTSRNSAYGKLFQENKIKNFPLTCIEYDEKGKAIGDKCSNYKMDNLVFTEEIPYGLKSLVSDSPYSFIVIVSEDSYKTWISRLQENDSDHIQTYDVLFMNGKNFKNIEREIKDMKAEEMVTSIYYVNVADQLKQSRNMVLVIKILLYGFIALVTLIGITSVFNTISTSLALRRKEFAMLRSMGLTPKGFKKILFLESFFFVLKSLVFAIPVSFGLIALLHFFITRSVYVSGILIPWGAVLTAILGSYLVVLMTTMYATGKMRKENILEAIREENI